MTFSDFCAILKRFNNGVDFSYNGSPVVYVDGYDGQISLQSNTGCGSLHYYYADLDYIGFLS